MSGTPVSTSFCFLATDAGDQPPRMPTAMIDPISANLLLPLFKKSFYYYMCMTVCTCSHTCRCHKKGLGSPGAPDGGSCELLDCWESNAGPPQGKHHQTIKTLPYFSFSCQGFCPCSVMITNILPEKWVHRT